MLKLTRIDELLRPAHSHLALDDECYALREYTARGGFEHSETNSLILNLKKSPSLQETPQWQHKLRAIETIASEFVGAINPAWLAKATLIPVPPSKAKDHPEYDDRIVRILTKMAEGRSLDVRCLLLQMTTMDPAHTGKRASIATLAANYAIDSTMSTPAPTAIGLFDDILTRGTHFQAAKQVLQARFGAVPVVGFFVARTVYADDEEGAI